MTSPSSHRCLRFRTLALTIAIALASSRLVLVAAQDCTATVINDTGETVKLLSYNGGGDCGEAYGGYIIENGTRTCPGMREVPRGWVYRALFWVFLVARRRLIPAALLTHPRLPVVLLLTLLRADVQIGCNDPYWCIVQNMNDENTNCVYLPRVDCNSDYVLPKL
jgi:hypothetical protein